MRNFDERMAEIKSRSHARMALRRKQIMSGCACCVLCLSIGTALLWPRNAVQPAVTEATNTTLEYRGKITVTCGSEKAEHSDPLLVKEVSEMIESLTAVQNVNQAFTHADSERNVSLTSLSRRFIIIIEDDQGVTTEYGLSGNLLINTVSQEIYELTTQQQKQLLELLQQ